MRLSWRGSFSRRASRQEGKQVKGVVLIESPYSLDPKPLPNAIIAHATKAGSTNDSGNASRQRVSAQFQSNAALLGVYKMPRTSVAYPKVIMLRSRETLNSESYAVSGIHGSVTKERDQRLSSHGRSSWGRAFRY